MAAPTIPRFAQLLQGYRRERNLTQEALAEMAGLSARGIRALEQGERTAPHNETVRRLADAMQLCFSDRATFEAAARHVSVGGVAAVREIVLPTGSFLGARPSGPLVAREKEISRALQIVVEVERGEGRLVMLAGEPGVGKTRLAQEVMLQLEERGFLVATGRCYEPEEAVPYYPFVEALVTAYKAAPLAIQNAVPLRWPYVEWLLPERLSAREVGESGGQDVQQRIFWAVAHFLEAIAETRPLALLLDDLQWADESSLKLLHYVARATRASRIFILGTYRDIDVDRRHPLEGVLRDLQREGLHTDLVVRRFAEEGTAALGAAMLGQGTMAQEFVALLHARTDGNPFFTQEVVRALMERGDLFMVGGVWRSNVEAEIEAPRTIRSAIGQRLSRLSEPAQEVLLEASVLGQTFAARDLSGLQMHSEVEVDDALDVALMAGLIRVIDLGRFSFNHALTQQTLYEELPARRRVRLHLSAAEALERLPDVAREKRAADLAWHFLQADEGARALPYAMLAGDLAEAVFAHSEALQHYRTALELARAIDNRFHEAAALERLGSVLVFGSQFDEALDLLERAVLRYRELNDPESEARTTEQIGNVLYRKGQSTEGMIRIRATVERLERLSGPPSFQRALAHLYWALAVPTSFPSANYAEILAISVRIAELGHTFDDPRATAHAMHLRGWCLSYIGSPGEARQWLQRAMASYEEVGNSFQRAHTIGNIARTYLHEGHSNLATVYLRQTLEAFEEIGDEAELAWALCYLGDVGFVSGDWVEARRHYERSAALTGTTVPRYYSHALLHLAELSLLEGTSAQAKDEIVQGLAVAEQCGEVAAIRKAGRLLAKQDLAAGDAEAALARLQPLIDGSAGERSHAFPPPVVAEAYLAVGDEARADELAAERIEQFRRQQRPRSLADWLRIQGKVRIKQGRWDEAQHAFQEAAAIAHSILYRYSEAVALYESALLHRQKGNLEDATERLQRALPIVRHLNARPYIELVEQALRDVG